MKKSITGHTIRKEPWLYGHKNGKFSKRQLNKRDRKNGKKNAD